MFGLPAIFLPPKLLLAASLLNAVTGLLGGIGVWLLQAHIWFVLPMLLVVLAFGMAIPNILGAALSNYTDRLGTAGALLGLFYYLLIGGGLMLAAWSQALGETLMICNLLALSLAIRAKRAFV